MMKNIVNNFMYLLAICLAYLDKCLFLSFAPFKIVSFVFLLLSCNIYLYTLDKAPYTIFGLQIIFSTFVDVPKHLTIKMADQQLTISFNCYSIHSCSVTNLQTGINFTAPIAGILICLPRGILCFLSEIQKTQTFNWHTASFSKGNISGFLGKN